MHINKWKRLTDAGVQAGRNSGYRMGLRHGRVQMITLFAIAVLSYVASFPLLYIAARYFPFWIR